MTYIMHTNTEVEFKTLLSKEEYDRLIELFKGNRTDFQTNHYFDTPRFSLKALDASLRVRERDDLELTLKRKKGYTMQEFTIPIDADTFKEIKTTGIAPESDIKNELVSLIGSQKLVNFLSLSTLRMYMPYKTGILFIDKSDYLGTTDYELEYEAKTYSGGKKEFIQIINELEIQYRKSDKKIRRAYNAYKRLH
ncbi:MAG: CYTH domain-containing protein [Bacilli bacterium]